MIVSPTRELAQQTFKNLNLVIRGLQKRRKSVRLQTSLFIGGKKSKASKVSETLNKSGKEGDMVIVGTPGRLRQELFSGDANGKIKLLNQGR